jgi:L-arabinokinase
MASNTACNAAATLLARLRAELSADFAPGRSMRVSRAPGRLDVMGGIADYTGSMVCEMPIDRAAAVALQERNDRQLQVFSFNLFDEHRPFTFRIPLDALAQNGVDRLRQEFNEPGRKFAAYVAGCLLVLHLEKLVDLADPKHAGMNLAVYSTVPIGAGLSSSAALEVATMMNLIDHFGIRDRLEPMQWAALCQRVENQVVGAPCGLMDQVTSCLGEAGRLLRMICQPHDLLPPLEFPAGVRVLGINSNVRHDVGGPAYRRTRCAAFMGHRIILETMRRLGAEAGRELISDPMNGYLANLDPDDYKRFFRSKVPERLAGSVFLDQFGPILDSATTVEPDVDYLIRHATDHHVLEARRVRRFTEFLTAAQTAQGRNRKRQLDSAGHLMYASHQSYTMDAMLGAEECDLLVQLVRQREHQGLYGARITGGGSGGTVAVLADVGPEVDEAVGQILDEYRHSTGMAPEVIWGSSEGAWLRGSWLE